MPVYQGVPQNKNVQQAVAGLMAYSLGNMNRTVAPTIMTVTTVQLTSPTAVVGVIVKEGNAPTVGQLVSITGAVPAYFNVSNAPITAVSSPNVPDNGVFTISFTLTNANVATTAASGLAVAPQIEIGENIFTGPSSQICIQSNVGPQNGRSTKFDVSVSGTIGAATIKAQSADIDLESEYSDLGTVATVVGGVVVGGSATFVDIIERFVRFNITGVAGNTSGKIVGKVLI